MISNIVFYFVFSAVSYYSNMFVEVTPVGQDSIIFRQQKEKKRTQRYHILFSDNKSIFLYDDKVKGPYLANSFRSSAGSTAKISSRSRMTIVKD